MTINTLDLVQMVGDKVLIRPKNPDGRTASGLYLPPTVAEKESVLSGYILKVGPGFPIAAPDPDEEPWKEQAQEPRFLPLQAKEGDFAYFLQKHSLEISLNEEKLLIVPQGAILMLVRDPDLFP